MELNTLKASETDKCYRFSYFFSSSSFPSSLGKVININSLFMTYHMLDCFTKCNMKEIKKYII